jgi:hypothetical protein
MTSLPLLAEIWSTAIETLPRWAEHEQPVIVADGKVHRVAELRESLHANSAYVVGARQRHLEQLSRVLQVKALSFKDLQAEDLSPLHRVQGLEWLSITWNTKLSSLEPLATLRGLTRLSISDAPKVRDLDPIGNLTSLVALNYSGGVWNKATAATLAPIARLEALEELCLTNLKILDGGLRPLAACRGLRRIELSNQFETADYAYLSVALPDASCTHFAPYVRVEIGGLGDAMVVGRRKPFLDSTRDAARIARYVADFERLQAGFRAALAGRFT